MTTDLASHVASLRHGVNVASLNYDIWWLYKSKAGRSAYGETMNRYLGFFDTSIHAHFVALLVALYPLYETRRETFSIPRLLKTLAASKTMSATVLSDVTRLCAEAKPIWLKVGVLRNNAFAHRSDSLTVEQVFAKAKATPDELKLLIELTKEILNMITRELNGSTHAFNRGATKAALRVLKDLKTHNGE